MYNDVRKVELLTFRRKETNLASLLAEHKHQPALLMKNQKICLYVLSFLVSLFLGIDVINAIAPEAMNVDDAKIIGVALIGIGLPLTLLVCGVATDDGSEQGTVTS